MSAPVVVLAWLRRRRPGPNDSETALYKQRSVIDCRRLHWMVQPYRPETVLSFTGLSGRTVSRSATSSAPSKISST